MSIIAIPNDSEFTVGEELFEPETIPGPVQLKEAPLLVDEPFRMTVCSEHVRSVFVPASAAGGV